MHNFIANYEKILDVLRKISSKNLQSYQRHKPKLSDLEFIGLSLTAEYTGIDSKNHLFRILPSVLSYKIDRSVPLSITKAIAQRRINSTFFKAARYNWKRP